MLLLVRLLGLGRQLRHGAHAAVDGLALQVEPLLIVGHDPHGAVGVEIPCHLTEGKAHLGELEQGPLEEVVVVAFEVDLAPFAEHFPVLKEETGVGQPPLGVPGSGPGVAEVDVDAPHLAGGEVVLQVGGVGIDEVGVGKAQLLGPLGGHHHGVRHPLHGHEEHVRLGLGGAHGEAALAAAQLHPDLPAAGQQLPPAAPVIHGVLDDEYPAGLQPGDQVGLLSHTHMFPSFPVLRFSALCFSLS